MYKFPKGGGKPAKLPIPGEEEDKANELHNELVEKAAENDEELMELYFEKGNLDEDELRKGLKIGMMKHDVFPIFCLSAKNNMGSGRLMGFIDNVAPAAIEMNPEITTEGEEIQCDPNLPPSIFVFKTIIEPFLGRVTYFKVISGVLKIGQDLINNQNDTNERFNQLFIMDGKNKNSVDQLVAGDIGATVKLKNTHTNHTLHDKSVSYAVQPMDFPAPRITSAIEPKDKKDDEKLAEVLREIHEEDPTTLFEYSKELKQLILSGQGELHFATTEWKLKHLHNILFSFIFC